MQAKIGSSLTAPQRPLLDLGIGMSYELDTNDFALLVRHILLEVSAHAFPLAGLTDSYECHKLNAKDGCKNCGVSSFAAPQACNMAPCQCNSHMQHADCLRQIALCRCG